jgi:hypothetical protein
MNRTVSVQGGLLDLYAPKFGLDTLGIPGEKVILKAVVESPEGRRLKLFATYSINGRHVQISTKKLAELGPEIRVVSVGRHTKENFIAEVNDALSRQSLQGSPRFVSGGAQLSLSVEGKLTPANLESMYTAAARVFALIKCQGATLRIALGDEVQLFDTSRRRLVGMRMKGEKLILERAFQNGGISR